MQPASAETDRLIRDGAELFRRGDLRAAERLCRQVLKRMAAHRDARVLLGLVLLADARFADAEATFRELAAGEPDEVTHWTNLGTACRGGKRYDAALVAYARAASLGEASADFYYNVGLTHIDRLDFESARAVFERAAALAPADAEIRYRLAQSCLESRRTEEAIRALQGWEEFSELTTEVTVNIGNLLMNLGEAAAADAAFARVARDESAPPHVVLTLIEALERTNRVPEARARLDRLRADPRALELGVDLLLTEAQVAEREAQFDTACGLYRRVLQEVHDPSLRHFQLFRLARCLDAAHRPAEAFEVLEEAHRSQVAYFALTVPALSLRGVPTMTITKYGCDAADVASWDHSDAPAAAESPIFIVAFPRSGTTLLELTLDAHPQLKSMDEQPFLQNALQGLETTGARYPEELGRVTTAQLDAVRSAYWQRVARKVRLAPGQRLVDKNPLNILRLPVIRRLFPRSRILLAVRHPCDVLFSCFLQHFRSPDFALLCADLGTLATGYRRTMDFWYQQAGVLEPTIREVRYESLVADFEPGIRGICEFLGLEWDERLLAPAAHARAKGYISTPSYTQVVQPVNQRSVDKWRAYETHFAAVLPILRPYLDRWGYAA